MTPATTSQALSPIKLGKWCAARLLGMPRVQAFELEHALGGSHRDVLLTLERPVEGGDVDAIGLGFGEEVCAAVEDARESYEGKQRFTLWALSPDRTRLASYPIGDSRKPRTRLGGSDDPLELTSSNTLSVIIGQLIRYNQKLSELVVGDRLAAAQQNQTLFAQVEEASERRMQVYSMLEELEGKKAERDVKMLVETSKAENRKAMVGAFVKHLPTAMDQMTRGALRLAGLVAPSDVGGCQDTLRRLWAKVDKAIILGALDEERRAAFDDLLGLGTDPESVEAYRNKLVWIWSGVPSEIADPMSDKIQKDHPEIAKAFASLFSSGEEARH